MKCPHCDKDFEIPGPVIGNARAYGGRRSHIRCNACSKVIIVCTRVKIFVAVEGKGDPAKVEPW